MPVEVQDANSQLGWRIERERRLYEQTHPTPIPAPCPVLPLESVTPKEMRWIGKEQPIQTQTSSKPATLRQGEITCFC